MSDSNTTEFNLTVEATDGEVEQYLRSLLADIERPEIDDLSQRLEQLAATVAELEDQDLDLDYDAIAEEVASRIDGGGGSFPEEELEALRRARQRAELAAGAKHVRSVETGAHEDDGFHPYGAWGVILSVEEPVQWRTADVHADSAGTVLLEVFEMEYEQNETHDLGERVASNELRVRRGPSTVPIEITLEPGTYFITRDSENPTDDLVALKRVGRDVDWSALNDGHECPVTLHETWQMGREPGTEDFDYLKEQGWHRTYHYWANPEFGFQSLGE